MTDGRVCLVGAGPGDPDLLTVRATRLLESADVVFVDALVSEAIRDLLDVRTIDVGKTPDGERTTQAEINERLVEEARDGKDVVRLKGGDPCVFGRGGEEAEYLAERDVPFEVVPGVTSAVGVPGSTGIPLTHREHASSISVVTGHEDPGKDESALDWDALARTVVAGGTLVVLMGVRRLPENATALRRRGVPEETPAAVIERGTREGEVAVTATLTTIAERARERGIEPPAVTVIGDVVGVREHLASHVADGTATASTAPEPEAPTSLPDGGVR